MSMEAQAAQSITGVQPAGLLRGWCSRSYAGSGYGGAYYLAA
jgi:hypothetical protein